MGKEKILLFLKMLGTIIKIFSIFNFLVFFVAIYFGLFTTNQLELYIGIIFLITGIFSFLIGHILEKKIKIPYENVKNQPYITIAAIAVAWLFIPLLGSIAYYISGLSFIDAYFESMSAWTTTGFTFYKSIENLPNSIKFWRSFQQWVGGIGIIAFILYLIRDNKILYSIVKFEGREEFIEPTMQHTIRKIFTIYLIITFIGVSLLSFSGVSFFNSLNLSMTAIATGGMIPLDFLDLTISQKIILIFLMMAGATSFITHSKLMEGKIKFLTKYEPLKWMIVLAILITVLGFLSNSIDIVDSLFHSISAITCTGFSYINLNNLSDTYIFGLIMLMIIGGAVGSTSGAVKIDRIIIFFKGIRKRIKEIVLPKDVVHIETYINNIIEDKDILDSTLYFSTYILVLMISSILFSLYTKNFVYAFFEVASAMGNVGLSLGYVSSFMPIYYKILFIFLMWGGRIEFITAIAFIYSVVKRWGM